MTEITVRGKGCVAQLHNKEVWILFKGYTLFLDDFEVDELIALLQALQQEMDAKQINLDLKVAEGHKIRRKSGVNRCIHMNTA